MNKIERGETLPPSEGKNAGTYETRRREELDSLAQELSEVRELSERGEVTRMSHVNDKMLRFIAGVKELAGTDVEQQVGDKGKVHFRAGDPRKPMNEGRLHYFGYTEQVEGKDQLRVAAFIDPESGSSWLMDYDRPVTGPWVKDNIYEQDVEAISKKNYGSEAWRSDALIRANRYREFRMAARMARMLISGSKETK